MEGAIRVRGNDRGRRDTRQEKIETLTYLGFQELTQVYSGSHEAGRIGVESDNDGLRYSEGFLNYLCGQREDRRGRRKRTGG